MSFATALENATKAAVCGWLANGGNAAAATWIVQGSKTPMTAVAGAAAGLGLLAVNYACSYDPDAGPETTLPGCWEVADGWATLNAYVNGVLEGFVFSGIRRVVSVEGLPDGSTKVTYIHRTTGQQTVGYYTDTATRKHRLDIEQGTCVTQAPTTPVPYEPYTYVDQSTSCTYVVSLEAFVFEDDATVRPVMKIEPSAAVARASGGVIGGCNFGPVIYAPGGGGDGGGGPTFPYEPGPDTPDGEPWWWPVLQAALGRLVGAALEEAIRKIFGQDPALEAAKATAKLLTGSEEGKLPAVVYDLTEICPPDGTPAETYEVPIPQAPALTGLAARSDALELLAQKQKDWKQPTCNIKPALTGEWVSVNFVSDANSPNGKAPLRKVLRYRDQTAAELLTHVEHWENFVWQAGPVWVASKNLSWGTPSCWAASIAEGKRVLGHAAQVAGVDLTDPKHEWVVSGSNDPRYGQPGTMRVERRRGGFIRVTKRTGPSGLPTGYSSSP